MHVEKESLELGPKVVLLGDKDIPTKFGLLSVDVNPQSLRDELISSVDAFYPSKSPSKGLYLSNAQKWAEKVVIGFDMPSLVSYLEDESMSRFSGNELGTFTIKSSTQESVFFLNVKALAERNSSQGEFMEDFRHVWAHERHHFVQFADPASALDASMEGQLVLGAWIMGGLGVIGAGAIILPRIVRKMDFEKKITRRNFLKGGILAGGTLLYLAGCTYGIGKGVNDLDYALPFTMEGQAEAFANSGKYTLTDLSKTFDLKVKTS